MAWTRLSACGKLNCSAPRACVPAKPGGRNRMSSIANSKLLVGRTGLHSAFFTKTHKAPAWQRPHRPGRSLASQPVGARSQNSPPWRCRTLPAAIEQQQRVVADRLEVPVVGTALLLTWNFRSNPCPRTMRIGQFRLVQPTLGSSPAPASSLRLASISDRPCSVEVGWRSQLFAGKRNVGSADTRTASLSSKPAKRL